MESPSLIRKAEGLWEQSKAKNSKESESVSSTITPTTIDEGEEEIDIDLILRRDPGTSRRIINRSAYVKLHRASSPHKNSTSYLKEIYETPEDEEDEEVWKESTIASLKSKYSPANYKNSSQIPIPKARRSLPNLSKSKDENGQEVERRNSSDSAEFITIVTRSESDVSIDKLEKELDLFVMEDNPKDKKKRSSSFRRIFSGKIFGKNKKVDEEPVKLPCKENVVYSDNMKNETHAFTRQTPYRHTYGGHSKVPKENKLYPNENQIVQKPNYSIEASDAIIARDIKLYRNNSQRSIPRPNLNAREVNRVVPLESKLYRNESQPSIPRSNYNVQEPADKNPKENRLNRSNSLRTNQKTNYIEDVNQIRPPPHNKECQYYLENKKQNENYQYSNRNNSATRNYNSGQLSYPRASSSSKSVETSSSSSTLDSERNNHAANNAIRQNMMRMGLDNRRPPLLPHQNVQQPLTGYPKMVLPKLYDQQNNSEYVANAQRNNPNYSTRTQQNNGAYSANAQRNNQSFSKEERAPRFEEMYGMVFDHIDRPIRNINYSNQIQYFENTPKIPESPKQPSRSSSLESTKLKLPPNREIIPLSPRMKSPIPQTPISPEKIIATELLKPPRSPRKNPDSINGSQNNLRNSDMYVPRTSSLSRSSQKIFYPEDSSSEIEKNRLDSPASTFNQSKNSFEVDTRFSLNRSSPKIFLSDQEGTTGRGRTSINSPVFDFSQKSPDSMQAIHSSLSRFQKGPQSNYAMGKDRTSLNSPVSDQFLSEGQDKIVTSALVHSNSPTSGQNHQLDNRSSSLVSVRSSTPVEIRSHASSNSQSPQKENIRRSVEAFYWKEIKKLKEQETQDMYYYQMEGVPVAQNYTADFNARRHRSRSVSPTFHRNNARSLSLPRDPRWPGVLHGSNRFEYPPPDGRGLANQQVAYHQDSTKPFAPNAQITDRIPRSSGNNDSIYKPIIKRGSLTTSARESDDSSNKRVSFSRPNLNGQNVGTNLNSQNIGPSNASTSRLVIDGQEVYGYGYTNKPPRPPNNPVRYQHNNIPVEPPYNPVRYQHNNIPVEHPYGNAGHNKYQRAVNLQEPPYGPLVVINNGPSQDNSREDILYERPADAVRPPANRAHQDPIYGQKPPPTRRVSYDSVPRMPPNGQPMQNISQPRYGLQQRREIIMTDEIFGQFGGYVPPQDNSNYLNAYPQNHYGYGYTRPKQVSIRNRVCDVYGQIHDKGGPSITPAYQQSGVVLGQLQRSPTAVGQAHPPPPPPPVVNNNNNDVFVRNSRLTASANDMYRRYVNVDPRSRSDVIYQNRQSTNNNNEITPQPNRSKDGAAPTRPLPPVPPHKKSPGYKEAENSSSDQLKAKKKNKKRSFFGRRS